MKSNQSLPSDDAGRFRAKHWSGVLHSAQSQVPGLRTAFANLRWLYTDPQALYEALIASEGRLRP